MAYEHLRLEKESAVTDRHRRPGFGAPPPEDPRGHGNALLRSFRAAREVAVNEDLGGFDDRKLPLTIGQFPDVNRSRAQRALDEWQLRKLANERVHEAFH